MGGLGGAAALIAGGETTEGAKFWMKVFNDLRTRGVVDILIAVSDGLSGMPAAVFPWTALQIRIVHLIRNGDAPACACCECNLEWRSSGGLSWRARLNREAPEP
jgi:hypothetical protein